MTDTATPPPGPAGWIRRLWGTHPPFAATGAAMLVLLVFFALGLVVDDRVVTGAPAWLKPVKFAISIAVYTFTVLWMLSLLPTAPRTARFARAFGWIAVVTFAAEMVAIAGQAARGLPSHFNVATPLDTAVWSVMGASVVILFLANVALAVFLLTQRFGTPSLRWAVRLGLAVAIVGMGQAFLMTSPTAQQLADARNGEAMPLVGAHAVGVRDGGPGLPIVGWSTEGGDLRAGHFVGIHALQVVPLLALLLARWRGLRERQRVQLVAIFASGYLGFTALLTWQALRAQPLLRPDAATVWALVVLVGATLAATAWVVVRDGIVQGRGGNAPIGTA